MNLIPITPFRQSDDSRCGPACVRMVLDYYKVDATEDEIAERCKHTYELGCTDEGMKAAFEYFGLGCTIENDCDLADLEYWSEHNIPIIVDWFADGYNDHAMPNGHSSVVVGIDRNHVHLMDPWSGQIRNIPRNEFLRVWFDWKDSDVIEDWKNMVIRQVIIAYPNRFTMQK